MGALPHSPEQRSPSHLLEQKGLLRMGSYVGFRCYYYYCCYYLILKVVGFTAQAYLLSDTAKQK